jgi:hypothetical protein
MFQRFFTPGKHRDRGVVGLAREDPPSSYRLRHEQGKEVLPIPADGMFWHGQSRNETKAQSMSRTGQAPSLGLETELADFSSSQRDTVVMERGSDCCSLNKGAARFYCFLGVR